MTRVPLKRPGPIPNVIVCIAGKSGKSICTVLDERGGDEKPEADENFYNNI